ncbi:MAG TPA: ACT domain-containing protein [Candidatus Thermoplasmatota archaeon]|nr:ACT domain-containing protein [Candidatus Thermoplasmatota archaeon]
MSSQIVVMLENRPGALAELASVLQEAGVNVEAILLEGSVDFGNVRLHVSAVRKAEKALRDAGYQYKIGETISLALPNEPGQLADVCRKLAKAKVNIEMMFGTAAASDKPALILMVDDPAKARKALGLEG